MFDGEAGTHVRQLGYLDQPLVHRVVAMDIRYDNLEQVVDLAAHSVKLHDFRNISNAASKFVQPLRVMLRSFDGNKDSHPHAKFVGIAQSDPLLDHASLFKFLNSPPSWGWRQMALT